MKNFQGKTVLGSLAYTVKCSALNGVECAKKNLKRDAAYDLKESSNGKFYVKINGMNGHQIAESIFFETKDEVLNLIESLKSMAESALVKDLTVE